MEMKKEISTRDVNFMMTVRVRAPTSNIEAVWDAWWSTQKHFEAHESIFPSHSSKIRQYQWLSQFKQTNFHIPSFSSCHFEKFTISYHSHVGYQNAGNDELITNTRWTLHLNPYTVAIRTRNVALVDIFRNTLKSNKITTLIYGPTKYLSFLVVIFRFRIFISPAASRYE